MDSVHYPPHPTKRKDGQCAMDDENPLWRRYDGSKRHFDGWSLLCGWRRHRRLGRRGSLLGGSLFDSRLGGVLPCWLLVLLYYGRSVSLRTQCIITTSPFLHASKSKIPKNKAQKDMFSCRLSRTIAWWCDAIWHNNMNGERRAIEQAVVLMLLATILCQKCFETKVRDKYITRR